MAAQLGNRSSSFNPVYPANATTGILQVENVSTVDNVVLATYRATSSGPGYAVGDIILYRQIGSNPPQYYSNNTVINNPDPNTLGPLSIATNVAVTSTTLPPQGATSTLQTTSNNILTDIVNALPTTGTPGIPSNEVVSIQGITGGSPVIVAGTVTSALSTADNTLLNDIKNRLVAVDNKLVSGNPIGAVQVTNDIGINSVNIRDGGNSITVDGAVDLTGSSATDLSTINNKLPVGLVVTNNRLVVDNTQQVQPVSGTVTANTGLIQPLTNAELRNDPLTVQLNATQLNSLIPPSNPTNLATETTLANVLTAVQGNINFSESIWTDDSGTYFARRVTQTTSGVTVNYYLANGSSYTPGTNPRPVLTDTSKELITTYYEAVVTNLPYYNYLDKLTRIDVLDTSSSAIVSSIWFNSNKQIYVPTPNFGNVRLLSTETKATEATAINILNSIKDEINFNETLWTDITKKYFIRRATQVDSTITTAYYLADGTEYTPEANLAPAFGPTPLTDREIVSSLYVCIGSGQGYAVGDYVVRYEVVDVNYITFVATFWYNATTKLLPINAPTPSHLSFATKSLPPLGQALKSASIPVTIASDQTNIPVTVTNPITVDTSLLAKETTLNNVLSAIQGNINFNETIWTDDTGAYFARRTTQTGSSITVSYYSPNGSVYTLGANPRPAFGTSSSTSGGGTSSTPDREIISNLYSCNNSGTGYTVGNNILRSDIVDVNSLATIATFYFNTATKQNIAAPTPSHLDYVTGQGYSTASLQTSLNTAIGSQADVVATTDTGSFSVISFIKKALQNWTSLLARIPVLGQATTAASIPVTLASNQPAISVTVTNPSTGGGTGGTSGTQYTEGDIDASITGTALLWEDASDTLRAVSTTKPLPVTIVGGGSTGGTGGSVDVSTLAKETGGNLEEINTSLNSVNSNIGLQTSPTTSLNSLFLDPNLSANTISLLKAIAVSNRQLTINTQVWSSGTLYDPNDGFDKSFTVPNNVNYHILYGSVQATTTNTVGNRILKIEIINFNNAVIYQTYAITYQSESKTYTYGISNSESSLLPDQNHVNLQVPVSLILYAGQKIRAVLIGGVTGDKVVLSLQIGTR